MGLGKQDARPSGANANDIGGWQVLDRLVGLGEKNEGTKAGDGREA